MTAPQPLIRSTELMSVHDTALVVIDVQEKLVPLLPDSARLVWNISRLVRGAKLLGLSVVGTEQYPRGLGPTVAPLAAELGSLSEKLAFSCGECGQLFANLADRGISKLLLAGIETHVCVQQSALDLLADGFRVYLAVDATASRGPLDREIALRRLENSGATLTTTEAALFEWCERAGSDVFKKISRLVRESPPGGL